MNPDIETVRLMTEAEKYRAFRNFMTNELGIDRSDIEAWTRYAVREEVQKLVGQMNLEKIVLSAAYDVVRTQVTQPELQRTLKDALVELVREQVKITIKGIIQ